jgi:hypothetical protein
MRIYRDTTLIGLFDWTRDLWDGLYRSLRHILTGKNLVVIGLVVCAACRVLSLNQFPIFMVSENSAEVCPVIHAENVNVGKFPPHNNVFQPFLIVVRDFGIRKNRMTMIKCSYCSITLQVMRTVFSGGHVSRRQLGGISRIGKFGVAFIPWPESSNVSVWSGFQLPTSWVPRMKPS